MKQTIKVRLRDVMAVRDLVNLVSQLSCPVKLLYEDKEVDAKSIMSIFTLDLSDELTLEIDGDCSPEVMDQLAPFMQ
ncbi:hypothetical protein SDC9_199163 [bioreactor metagenome]|uniref:HPr domain-containing protein n=1 Tax=bioreactor metagenome TaxID=1076179 RepID=A0A645IJP5_9ZZZZ